jgi:transposase
MKAMELLEQGYQPVEVAKALGVDRRSVRRWKAAYRKKGVKAVCAKPVSGRPPKLGAQARKKLQRLLLKGARSAGFHNDLWTCPRVAQVIERHFGVRYHVDHIGRLLHAVGFTPQRPQRRAIERDEKQVQNWINRQWPRIKKKPPA